MTKLTFNSAAGSDGLTINNPAVGLFAPVGGIDYNGGGQAGDLLNLLGVVLLTWYRLTLWARRRHRLVLVLAITAMACCASLVRPI